MPSSFGIQTHLIVFLSKSLLPRDGLLVQSTIRTPLDRHFWLTLNHFGDKNDKATERVTLHMFRSNEQYEIQCITKVDVKLHLYEYQQRIYQAHQLHFDKTLQVEGVKSLKEAVVRALEIKDIQENNIFHFLHNQVKSDRNVQLERFSRKSSSGRDGEKDCRDKSFWNSNESK
ncbi:hypothetical protein HZH68_016155 [Vespula germanica]|uniref:Uncharacterized protein n=1 Tax=Vespula germanica TaxID=30212 RepID=A0A834J4C9_VESGE|nr:hypothetical protein HZH68_016155 [Vespula germanica]